VHGAETGVNTFFVASDSIYPIFTAIAPVSGMVGAMSFNWKRIRCNTSRSAAGREGRGQRAVFFTTEVDVAALVQQEQGQACDHDKSEYEFPHFSLLQKKAKKKPPAHG
jgi:hypothetical protein